MSASIASSAAGPVILFGIDGGTWRVIEPAIAAGRLPTLARLCAQGCSATLLSTWSYCSASAWASVITGLDIPGHGIWNFVSRVPGQYAFETVSSGSMDGEPFWRHLDARGLRSAILNIPILYPVIPNNGIQLAGWLAPSVRSPGYAHPPELASELLKRFGSLSLLPDVKRFVLGRNYQAAVQNLRQSCEQWERVFEYLFAMERWDLFAAVFTPTDAAHHWLWHLYDSKHPDHDPRGAAYADALVEAYEVADRCLGRLLDAAGPEATVVVISDHGSGPNTRAGLFLSGLLEQMGLQKSIGGDPRRRRRGRGLIQPLIRRAYSWAQRRLPADVKVKLRGIFQGLEAGVRSGEYFAGFVWPQTRAFAPWDNTAGAIWLNVKGRDAQGIVEPGAEYEALCSELVQRLQELRDLKTGRKLVKFAARKSELFSGPHLDRIPDIVIVWDTDTVVEGVRLPLDRGGELTVAEPETDLPHFGAHELEGVFIAAGPGIRHARLPDASILDIAPTILALFGLAPPAAYAGRVLEEAFVTPPTLQPVEGVEHGRPDKESAAPEPTYTEEEEQIVEGKLRDLGYI